MFLLSIFIHVGYIFRVHVYAIVHIIQIKEIQNDWSSSKNILEICFTHGHSIQWDWHVRFPHLVKAGPLPLSLTLILPVGSLRPVFVWVFFRTWVKQIFKIFLLLLQSFWISLICIMCTIAYTCTRKIYPTNIDEGTHVYVFIIIKR